MASTYSTNLKIELIGVGEQSGAWGTSTNTNLGTAIEQAIVGKGAAVFSTDADLTLSLSNTSAAQVARAFVLNVTSGVSLTTTRNLVVPTIEKPYVVMNNTTGGQSIVVKTSAGSGITVPNGSQVFLYVDGTNVIQMLDAVGDLSYTGTLTGGTGVVNLGSGQLYKDASGNVGLGVTPSAFGGAYKGFQIGGNPVITGANAPDICGNAYHDGTNWRYIGTNAAARYSVNNSNGGIHAWYTAPSGTAGNPITFTQAMGLDDTALTGGADNVRNLGSGAKRWAVVYAATGTINTSDAREKTAVRSMAADEVEAAKALSKEIGVYQFLDSVAVKGDKARHHIGMTVQRAIEIMEAHGLNPFAYGFICYDKWDEETKEHPAIEARDAVEAKAAVLDADGNVVEPAVGAQPAVEARAAWAEVTLKAGDRYSFRYDQLTLFIARGLHARLEALEAK